MMSRTSRGLSAVLTVSALLALGACGGEESDPKPDKKADQQTEQETPTPAADVTATCSLKGKAGGEATLTQSADGLTMTFTGLPVPAKGTALYSVMAYDDAGEQGGQYGVKFLDGEQIAFFVYDFGESFQTNIDGEAEVTDKGVSVTADDSDLGALSGVEVGSWSASYNVNGNDVGECPGGFESLPFPG